MRQRGKRVTTGEHYHTSQAMCTTRFSSNHLAGSSAVGGSEQQSPPPGQVEQAHLLAEILEGTGPR